MTIKLHTVNLEVSDPNASKHFYVEVLGLSENEQRSNLPDFIYLESEGCDVTVAKRSDASNGASSQSMELGFLVDDLTGLKTHLMETTGNTFKPQSMGWGDVLEGHDPDGHRVIIYCLHQKP